MDAKTQKYDRQLRMWGEHGQRELEKASVCLVNATAVGAETLKNLVLPALGSFTVVDGQRVTGADAGNNFFLTVDSIGQSRARCTTELLMELNEDVSGNFVEEDVAVLLDARPSFFTRFSVVIATSLSDGVLLRLAAVCWEANVPLLYIECVGFIGWLRLVVPEHTFIEAHPETDFVDLRLDRPLAALSDWAASLDFAHMDAFQLGQLPFPLVLLGAISHWHAARIQSGDHRAPLTRADKDDFKAFLRGGAGVPLGVAGQPPQTVDEAIANAHRLWVPYAIPSRVARVLRDEATRNLTPTSSKFWYLARAVADFVDNEGEGYLPLSGSIPDMEADTANFIRIQNIYREKSMVDIEAVTHRLHALLLSMDKRTRAHLSNPDCLTHMLAMSIADIAIELISDAEIRLFCKNAHNIGFIRYRSIAEEYEKEALSQSLGNLLSGDASHDAIHYVLLRAAHLFHDRHARFPGAFSSELEGDIGPYKRCVHEAAAHMGITVLPCDDLIHEMCRYGGAEMHAVAAVMGGIASQEAIKMITRQFVPVCNAFIFNGAKGTAAAIEL